MARMIGWRGADGIAPAGWPARRRGSGRAAPAARRRGDRSTPPQLGSSAIAVERLVTAGVDDVAVRLRYRRRRRACAAPSSCRSRARRSAPGCRPRAPSAGRAGRCAAGSSTSPTAPASRTDTAGQQRSGSGFEPRPERRPDVAQRRRGADRASQHGQLGRRRRDRPARAGVDRAVAVPCTTQAAASPRGRWAPELWAAWNTTVSPAPSRSIARPGVPRANAAGSAAPTMSTASARSWRRKAMRRLVLARISSLTTPAGRCVASTRWIPRLRPRWATPTSGGRKPGQLGGHRGELVDDHDEARQRRRSPARRPVGVEVVGAGLRGACAHDGGSPPRG